MNLRIKNEIENKINKIIIKSKRIKSSGANLVYEIKTNDNKNYIFKLYKLKRDMTNINKLNNYLKQHGINTLTTVAKGNVEESFYYIYNKNEGRHKLKYTKEMINKILDVIECEFKNETKIISNNSIIDKYLIYREYFKNNITKKISSEVIEYVNKIAEKVNLNFKNMCLIHGDLSITNILWNHENFSIIDFDESIYAPIEYEIASFIIKNCFTNGNFNKKIAKTIMKCVKSRFTKVTYNSLKNSWTLFILKVIYEKFYYYELNYTDIETLEHKKDYWAWWYKLLKNEKVFDEIYFADLTLSKIVENQQVIKSNDKSVVKIVTLNNESFVLKKRKRNKEENAKVEQELLEQLSVNLNVPRILKLEQKKNYDYKLYTLMEGKQKIRCNKEEENKLIEEFFKLMYSLSRISIKVKNGNVKRKIKKLIYMTNNKMYKECLYKMLWDSEFMKRVKLEQKQIIHDDLNACNILFSDNNKISFIDFEGVKKYPKSLQIASFITNRYIYEGDISSIDYIISKLNVDREYILKLIVYRSIKTLIFFENQLKEGNNEFIEKEERLQNSLIEIINILEV